jgi:hypothetical protein
MQGKECAEILYRYVKLRRNGFKFRRNIIWFFCINIEGPALQEKFDNAPKA